LRERNEAERRHRAAATEGRATAIMKKEQNILSFSVYPVAAGERKKVETRFYVPIERELGRYRVRIPVDEFLGQPAPRTSVLVELKSDEPIADFGVSRGSAKLLRRGERSLQLVLPTRAGVELWWAEAGPPLLLRAEAVALDDGDLGLRIRAALNDAERWRGEPETLEILIDASYSMRRRAAALRVFLDRLSSSATAGVRFHTIAERAAEWSSAEEALEAVLTGATGHRGGARLLVEIERLGCSASARCAVVTDPQLAVLEEIDAAGVPLVLLSDVHERAHFADDLPPAASIHLPGVDPEGRLLALADQLVRPVLEIESISQSSGSVEFPGRQSIRVAEGSILRLHGRIDDRADLEVRGTIDGQPFTELLTIELLDSGDPAGSTLRRGVFRELLASWMERYRREPGEELKRRIVEISLREGIPTALTALQVDDPRLAADSLPATATSAGALILIGAFLAILAALIGLPALQRRAAG